VDFKAGLVELDKLVGIFYSHTNELGEFVAVGADDVPEPQRSLLNHDFHMTVTVEKFHSSPVDVEVLRERAEEETYVREIRLTRQSDGQIVQFGIVRLHFKHLDDAVRSEIQGRAKPLGRILIDHNVLRRVQLLSLYRIQPSPKLATLLGLPDACECYGRTAIIYCNDEPAIELLEIVRI
jgi:chorismate-pyruvate lyase